MAVLSTPLTEGHETQGRARIRRRTGVALVLTAAMVWLAVGAPDLRAQASNPKEYQIKAIFLFNFIQFVEWPASAFDDAGAPIRIGVLGDDPFDGALEAAVQGEKIRQRALVVQRAHRIGDLSGCHVIFVCRSERGSIGKIIPAVGDKPILTVGDMPDFAHWGGIINFYLEGQKVRFEINRVAAQRCGLKLSSQLLRLARIVGPAVEG